VRRYELGFSLRSKQRHELDNHTVLPSDFWVSNVGREYLAVCETRLTCSKGGKTPLSGSGSNWLFSVHDLRSEITAGR
jgi:hypothetical protein